MKSLNGADPFALRVRLWLFVRHNGSNALAGIGAYASEARNANRLLSPLNPKLIMHSNR